MNTQGQTQNTTKTQAIPTEGQMTKNIERQTAKIPSMAFLLLAGGSLALSATMALVRKDKSAANFFGLWVPSFLLIGIYNKLVKLEGSDWTESRKLAH